MIANVSEFMNEVAGEYNPLVTVVVPTCHRPAMLLVALHSIARQTYPDFECLVVNDHAPTAAAVDEVVEALADPRFRVVHNATPSGAATTRNHGIRQARGSILAFLDDDDTWLPNYLEEHVSAHRADVGLIYSGVVVRWQDQVLPEKLRPAIPPPPREEVPARMLRGTFEIFTTSVISVKRQALEEVGCFDELLPSYEDWELCYRVGQRFPLGYVAKPLTIFFQHLKGRMTQDLGQRRAGLKALQQKFKDDDRFEYLYRKHVAQMYFTSIRSNVLAGKAEWNRSLFTNYLQSNSHPWSSVYQLKVTVKMLILLVFKKAGLNVIRRF